MSKALDIGKNYLLHGALEKPRDPFFQKTRSSSQKLLIGGLSQSFTLDGIYPALLGTYFIFETLALPLIACAVLLQLILS